MQHNGANLIEAQAALARQWAEPQRGAAGHSTCHEPPTGDGLVTADQAKTEVEEAKLPRTVEAAIDFIRWLERGASSLRSDADVAG